METGRRTRKAPPLCLLFQLSRQLLIPRGYHLTLHALYALFPMDKPWQFPTLTKKTSETRLFSKTLLSDNGNSQKNGIHF